MNTSKPAILRELFDAGKAVNKYGTQKIGSSSETFPKAYKPGGTMVGTMGHISGRIEADGVDSKGRWNWVKLTGKKVKKSSLSLRTELAKGIRVKQDILLPSCSNIGLISKII